MKNTTLVFLVKRNSGKITHICLAMKKRGFGAGRYNGAGGKLETGESIGQAARRETKEEIGVTVSQLKKCAEFTFENPFKPDWNQVVHAYVVDSWQGDPRESEEMMPEWFAIADIPYQKMWPDDAIWMPHVLENKFVTGTFVFDDNGSIASHTIALL